MVVAVVAMLARLEGQEELGEVQAALQVRVGLALAVVAAPHRAVVAPVAGDSQERTVSPGARTLAAPAAPETPMALAAVAAAAVYGAAAAAAVSGMTRERAAAAADRVWAIPSLPDQGRVRRTTLMLTTRSMPVKEALPVVPGTASAVTATLDV